MYGEECCPMSSFRSEWAARPDFHPEFGYLCPSARRRRRVRFVLVAATAVLAVGATMALAAAHRGDAEGRAAAVQRDASAEVTQASTSAADAVAAPAPAPMQDACKAAASGDPVGSFLDRHCRSSKQHVRHGARAAYRVAVVILGRTDAPPVPAEAAPVTAAGNDPAGVEKPVAAMSPAPLAHATPHPKKPRADATLALSRQNATIDAYAYDPYYNRYRADSLQRGYGGWFGGR
jgi:hypothetical protein